MPTTPTRLLLPDAVRGIAASMVAFFHFYMAAHIGLKDGAQLLPSPLHTVALWGDGGVHIFFLLSGFILAYSLHSIRVTPALAMRFLVRRSLRLDPVYWAAIALAIALTAVKGADVSWFDIPFNMFYADNLAANIAPVHSFVAVGWTLQFEFQFYIIFIGVFACEHRAGTRWFLWLHGLLLVAALVFVLGGARDVVHGLFLEHWPLFALGVMTARVMMAPTFDARALWTAALVVNVAIAAHDRDPRPLLGVGAGLLLGAAPIALMQHPLSASLQFLGKISYSFYLFHPFVGIRFMRMILVHWPTASSMTRAALVVVAFALSTAVSALMWWMLERPAQRLSRMISLRT
jgi:peptidoglycan/LPS O-acetylase OafA/YrhL